MTAVGVGITLMRISRGPNDRYRGIRSIQRRVTDDADDPGGTRAGTTGSVRPEQPADDGVPDGPNDVDEVDFGDLSLPQRVFVAAVQNPTRGVVIVALFAFAFSFYIAFWMVFPRIAAGFSVFAVVLGVLLGGVYYLFGRYAD